MLRAIRMLAPDGWEIDIFERMGELPLFNPDIEMDAPPVVRHFHARVDACDVLIIASPEYAHGVTGTIKNALDWLVGFEPFAGKPVAVLNASPRATHADEALKETLRTMAAQVLDEASITLPILGSGLDDTGIAMSQPLASQIRGMFDSLFAR
ncbi:NAD(P)H-dependent oxidoreductase [Luteibacter aegosomaticola]|uniref:NADPH-dependent FMN reductase n=1 Tax=Luteibacter aegosomaticola TaxID=2911538 RepID=UPI001FF813B1|nr:NADPH-dependent FMN reductase [Luteibacter aegosomaticola]UPG90698.1 NAD(P)H-dependent oxidoreductase [Luteibacter aegosomaticola]